MAVKLDKCPKCGNKNLGDHWSGRGPHGRMLEQVCEAELDDASECEDYADNGFEIVPVCGWKGEPRTPEPEKITGMRPTWAADRGSQIEIFDRFGHTMAVWSPHTKNPLAEAEKDLERGLKDEDAGPYTAVIWNGSVRKGRIYQGVPAVWINQPPAKRMVTRKNTFKQDTPRMQLVALIQAVQGDLGNMPESPATGRCLNFLSQAQDILKDMPEGQWQKD